MNINKLQKAVLDSKLSKSQIAEKCGFTRVTLDNALQGADVKVSTIESLAKVLGISVGTLFDEGSDIELSTSKDIIDNYKREIDRLQSLLYKQKKSTKVVVELDVDDDEFIKMGLKDKVIQILNK